MGNILTPFKRFLSNKNTVTILGVLLGIAVLYVGYSIRVKEAVTPVPVPYAKEEIPSRTVITEEMIGFTEVPSSMLKNNTNLVTNSNEILDKQVSYATTIPKNSLFYKSSIVDKGAMPDSPFENIPDGYTVFSLSVDLHSTYGNSIFPGNTIDLWMSARDDAGQIIYAPFIKSIEVQAVRDSKGQPVFETTTESRTPAEILFYVEDEMYELLSLTKYITSSSIELHPVPRNASYSANPGDVQVASQQLEEFIRSKASSLGSDAKN